MNIDEFIALFNNAIVWAITTIAFICYSVLIDLCFLSRKKSDRYRRIESWNTSLSILITSLPLLGLLGTITGLMKTFFTLSLSGNLELQELMANGISDAMFTTQLGLTMAIPGMILYMNLQAEYKKHILENNSGKA